jgi:hypothetical protein
MNKKIGNCEKCKFFRYHSSWGHGWCYNDKSQYSGKIRGSGKSCNLIITTNVVG